MHTAVGFGVTDWQEDQPAAQPARNGIMFNIRPEWDLPGLHNFKPPENEFPGLHNFKVPAEEAPGFRMNVDGSIRQTAVPTAWP